MCQKDNHRLIIKNSGLKTPFSYECFFSQCEWHKALTVGERLVSEGVLCKLFSGPLTGSPWEAYARCASLFPPCYKDDRWPWAKATTPVGCVYEPVWEGGGCREQEAYGLGNNISLQKTCFLCLDANQGQSSLADQGRGRMEVSCHHVFEEEEEEKDGEMN